MATCTLYMYMYSVGYDIIDQPLNVFHMFPPSAVNVHDM